MKKFVAAIALAAFCAACSPGENEVRDTSVTEDTQELTAETVVGDWSGQLSVPGGPELWLVFHITEADEEGGLAITMDSPDQGAMGIAGENASVEDGTFQASFPVIGARFTMTPGDGEEMKGAWIQGLPMPFALTRGNNVPARARPQEPQTRDYVVETVSFPGGADDVELAGELTLPAGDGPFPALVLISGSGPQDRNEELMGHRPFLVLSDHLTRSGYAVLRYDDRGFSESTGDYASATTRDFADDAAAALAYLKADARIDAARTAYVGHSEGGLVAPMATQVEPAAALVLLAGPAVPLSDVLLRQTADIMRVEGASEEDIETALAVNQSAFDIARAGNEDADALEAEMKAAFVSSGVNETMAENMSERMTGPWMAWIMDYDPVPALEAYDGPVLALFGSMDVQVAPDASEGIMREALSHPDSDVVTLDGLNHLFQPAETGAMSEYLEIETTMDPAALEAVSDWLDDALGAG